MFVCKGRNPLPVAARGRRTDSVTLSWILAPFPCLLLASGVTHFRNPKEKHWLCCGFKTKQRAGLARVLQMLQGGGQGPQLPASFILQCLHPGPLELAVWLE